MAYDVIDTSNFGRFLGKIKTLLTGFWSKADTTELTIDNTPTANSNNLVKSGGVKSYVDGAIPSVPVQDVTVGGSSVVSSGTAAIPAIPDAVEANPTVPSGTTPTTLANLKVGNGYYSVPQHGDSIVNAEVANPPDGTVIFTQRNGDAITLDLNHTHPQYALKIEVASSQPAGGMAPNTLYNLGTLTGATTFAFAAPTDNNILNEYMFNFDSGSTAVVPTWPNTITNWVGNCLDSNGEPVIAASKHYEVSVIGAYGYINEF